MKKYLPDILINLGVWTFSYYSLIGSTYVGGLPKLGYTDYHVNEKMLGLMVITIGLNIVIRRYLEARPK